MINWNVYMIHYTTWLIKRSEMLNKLHANTNYSRDYWSSLVNCRTNSRHWTVSFYHPRHFAPCITSRYQLTIIIRTMQLDINSRSNLRLAFQSTRQWNAFLIQQWIRPLTSPRRSSWWNSKECPVRFKWLRTDARADARCSNASCCNAISMD
jgi:hypothetical protein